MKMDEGNIMRYLLAMILLIVPLTAFSATSRFSLLAEYFDQQGYEIAIPMPCDWDRQVRRVRVFAYYGKGNPRRPDDPGDNRGQGSAGSMDRGGFFQDLIRPEDIERFGSNILITIDEEEIKRPRDNDKKWHHVEVQYRRNRRFCRAGFRTLFTKDDF